MRACMCSLAGTRACDYCSNGPSRSWAGPFVVPVPYKAPEVRRTWSVTSISDIHEKEEDKKSE